MNIRPSARSLTLLFISPSTAHFLCVIEESHRHEAEQYTPTPVKLRAFTVGLTQPVNPPETVLDKQCIMFQGKLWINKVKIIHYIFLCVIQQNLFII